MAGVDAMHRELLENLEELRPPPQARDAHGEYVAACAEVLAVFENFIDSLGSGNSPPGLTQIYVRPSGPAWEAAAERLESARLQLQALADENGIALDLECE